MFLSKKYEIEAEKKTVMPAFVVRIPKLYQVRSLAKDKQVTRKYHAALDGHI